MSRYVKEYEIYYRNVMQYKYAAVSYETNLSLPLNKFFKDSADNPKRIYAVRFIEYYERVGIGIPKDFTVFVSSEVCNVRFHSHGGYIFISDTEADNKFLELRSNNIAFRYAMFTRDANSYSIRTDKSPDEYLDKVIFHSRIEDVIKKIPKTSIKVENLKIKVTLHLPPNTKIGDISYINFIFTKTKPKPKQKNLSHCLGKYEKI